MRILSILLIYLSCVVPCTAVSAAATSAESSSCSGRKTSITKRRASLLAHKGFGKNQRRFESNNSIVLVGSSKANARSIESRGGGGGTKSIDTAADKRRRSTVLVLVALALFNDALQCTMLAPIIHTLVVDSPPPLGVTSNGEIALGIFFASKDICQLTFAPLAGILTARTSPNAALILSTAGLGLATFVFAEAKTFPQLLLARGAQGE
jgi:hypothetical protein